MDIVLEQFALHISQISGDVQLVFPLQPFDCPLNLLKTALSLQPGNGGLDLIVGAAPEGAPALLLIKVGHLGAQMPAAGMDHQKQAAVLGPIHFNKVVAAAKGADAVHGAAQVDLSRTAELCQINPAIQRMGRFPHLPAIGNLLADQPVQPVKVDLPLGQLHRLHAAADINAHHAGHDFVLYGHGGADCAALAGMDVGHDPNFAAGKLRPIAHRLDLVARRILQCGGVADGGII